MNAMVYETNCGEWDVITSCDDKGDCKILKGFASEKAAIESVANLGWRFIGTVRLLYTA